MCISFSHKVAFNFVNVRKAVVSVLFELCNFFEQRSILTFTLAKVFSSTFDFSFLLNHRFRLLLNLLFQVRDRVEQLLFGSYLGIDHQIRLCGGHHLRLEFGLQIF